MSVRQGMLALLAEEPTHCYHLRQRFEERTGGTWPLNIGQAYTTVQRLVRDGLVELVPDVDVSARPDDDGVPASDGGVSLSAASTSPTDDDAREAAGSRLATRSRPPQHVEQYRLTAAGRDEVDTWWTTPVVRGTPARDELAIKIALAVTAPGVDVRAVVQTQRAETMRALRDYTRLAGEQGSDLTWALVLDSLVFTTEAEVRWLDHVEARIARATPSGTASGTPRTTETTTANLAAAASRDGVTARVAGPQGGPAAEASPAKAAARASSAEGAR